MKENLFDIPESESPRLKWKKKVVEKYSIFTHYYKGHGWMAFSMTKALEMLSGYSLTDEQKTEPIMLFAGYCRLLDEAGLVADRMETEFDAICEVCKRHNIKLWNEE